MRPVVTGSIAFDYLMSFPGRFEDHFLPGKLDKISVSFLVDELNLRRGGCAANISYSLALLGEKPLLVGAAGSDFGPYGKDLESMGVDLSGVLVKEDVLTASFFANTDQEGNQIASFFTGAMQYAREISLPRVVQERDP
ncbi:MAG TPA: carbohydrate kinase family protein, partial [Planctomycetes bacterium]|nr:carbohydrate kinase family protein [Planctomycetota bacterium]